MADQDFNIKVVTTADLSGVNQVDAGLRKLSIDEANRLGKIAEARRASLRSALSAVPSELTGGVTGEGIKEVEKETLFAGVNMARLRNETVTFTRELASGAPTARTLGALLGALGPKLIGGALAGIVVKSQIEKITEEQTKVTAELDKQGEKVVELGVKWREMAKGALTSEDVQKVAEAGIGEFQTLHNRITEVAGKDLPVMESTLDAVARAFKNAFTFGGDPNAKGPFQAIQDELLRGLGMDEEQLRKLKRTAIDAAESSKEAFRFYETDLPKAIDELNQKISDQEELQKKVGKDNVESYVAIGKVIEKYKAELAEIIKLEKEHAKILANKQAAAKAQSDKATEAEKRATALASRQGQTPAQQEETSKAQQEAAAARAEAQRQEDEIREQKRKEAQKASDFAEVKKYGRVLSPQERAQETIKEREELGQKAGQAQNKELQEKLNDQMTEQLRGISPEQLANEREAKGIKSPDAKEGSQGIIQAIEKLNQKFDQYWR